MIDEDFIRLDKQAKEVLDLVESDSFPLKPEVKREEVLQLSIDDLKSLAVSISYYAAMPPDTFYVAFVGHYSSGKSSTINSLLGTDRSSGVNPTDERLTFISNQDKLNHIKDAIRKAGPHVSAFIDCQDVGNEFLANIVLIDTPGRGDPRIDRALIHNFMPVCDIIGYFTTAAAPFDDGDIEILQRYIGDLSFVEMFFVVTRADEFKINRKELFSDENFDLNRAEKDISVAKARLRKDFKLPGIDQKPHYLIDNIASFGIDNLRNYIISSSNVPRDRTALILGYFQERFQKSLDRIIEYVSEIRTYCTRAIDQFKKNVTDFDKHVNVESHEIEKSILEFELRLTKQQRDFQTKHNGALREGKIFENVSIEEAESERESTARFKKRFEVKFRTSGEIDFATVSKLCRSFYTAFIKR